MKTACFPDWTPTEYKEFLVSFLENYEKDDVLPEIKTKNSGEVFDYYQVFIERSNELKCYEQIARKEKEKEYRELNKKTILEFSKEKMD